MTVRKLMGSEPTKQAWVALSQKSNMEGQRLWPCHTCLACSSRSRNWATAMVSTSSTAGAERACACVSFLAATEPTRALKGPATPDEGDTRNVHRASASKERSSRIWASTGRECWHLREGTGAIKVGCIQPHTNSCQRFRNRVGS